MSPAGKAGRKGGVSVFGKSALSRMVREADSSLSLSERISRNVSLASALEPIGDKEGCTTRYVDLKPSKALELFLAAGINVAPAFSHEVEYLQDHRAPAGIYRFFREAVVLSKALRAGGKINQGIIEPLVPIVAAQVLFDPGARRSPSFVLGKVPSVLKMTRRGDVESLIEGKEIANALSGFTRYRTSRHRVGTVWRYYEKEVGLEGTRGNPKGIVFNRELLTGLPAVRLACNQMLRSGERKLSDRSVYAYDALRRRYPASDLGVGGAADYIAVAMYLLFTYAGDTEPIA